MTESNRAVVGAALYAALTAAWIYGIADSSAGDSTALWLIPLAAIQLLGGYVTAQWWALALPLLAILIAVPAGMPSVDEGEPLPIWFAFVIFALPEAALVAIGVLAGRRRAS